MVIKKEGNTSKFHMRTVLEHISNCWPVPFQTFYPFENASASLEQLFEGWYKWSRGHGPKIHPGQFIAFKTLF